MTLGGLCLGTEPDSLVVMGREDLEQLSKPELIDLVLKLQLPAKTSRTSSTPPSTDRKERREQSRPGGAKPGNEGHKRVLSADPEAIIDHRPTGCPDCGLALSADLPAEVVSVHEEIDIAPVKPRVEQHRRLSMCCPGCGTRDMAERPAGAGATPFGPRFHALALYLKTFQALSYERLQSAMKDLFGLDVSQGGLTNMLRLAEAQFAGGRDTALAALHRAKVVACDETGIRIEGTNRFHWVFRCAEAVVHHVAPTRGAVVVRDIMGEHKPDVWLSDRHAAQQGTARRTRPVWPTWPATSPTRSKAATRPWRWASSCGSARPSPWPRPSPPWRPRPSRPNDALWSAG